MYHFVVPMCVINHLPHFCVLRCVFSFSLYVSLYFMSQPWLRAFFYLVSSFFSIVFPILFNHHYPSNYVGLPYLTLFVSCSPEFPSPFYFVYSSSSIVRTHLSIDFRIFRRALHARISLLHFVFLYLFYFVLYLCLIY